MTQNRMSDRASRTAGNGWSAHPWIIPAMLPHDLDWTCNQTNNQETAPSVAADIYEDVDHYYVCLEVPGIKRQDLALELKDRILTVKGQRFQKRGKEEAGQPFSRTIAIPTGIVWENITAKLEDGILTVTLPKSEEVKPRVIPLS